MQLQWKILSLNAAGIVDEAHVEFYQEGSDIVYQRNSVLVPKRATADEIKDCIGARCAALEAEGDMSMSEAVLERKLEALPLPVDLEDKLFNSAGKVLE